MLHDETMPKVEIDQLFQSNTELRICGDLCNATKHLVLSFPKQPREFSLGRAYRDPSTGWFGLDQSETYTVLSDGKSYEIPFPADACVSLWVAALLHHHPDVS